MKRQTCVCPFSMYISVCIHVVKSGGAAEAEASGGAVRSAAGYGRRGGEHHPRCGS